MAILNEPLYQVLLDEFDGNVDVVHEGDPGVVSHTNKRGKLYAVTEDSSQEFRVDCPFCGDTRGRLYISYLVGTKIKHRGEFVKTYGLMNCKNEQCKTIELYKKIRERISNPPNIDVAKLVANRKPRPDLIVPLKTVAINKPKAAPAPVSYMLSRGFDLDELADVFHVKATPAVPGVEHLGQMVLFPAYDGERLTFWQARMSYDPPKGSNMPKYYFPEGSNKSSVVYNRYNALTEEIVVITEGVLDAIRVGKAGIAIFGKCPSKAQTRIMSRAFKRKVGVLMLDSDAAEEAQEWYDKYKGDVLFAKGLYIVRLTKGDPADHTREELWELIVKAMEEGNNGL